MATTQREPPCGWSGHSTLASLALALLCGFSSPLCGGRAFWACQMLFLQGETGLQGPKWVGDP